MGIIEFGFQFGFGLMLGICLCAIAIAFVASVFEAVIRNMFR